ncbi:MAG TPA: hypothetical protein VEF76_11435 [Patescibacteria group bacterium]|nr:hypothetical protein [Patescibacteria group bacterium]
MRGIKLLVAVMTALIVICLGLLGWGVARQSKALEKPAAAGAASMPELVLPALARVDQLSGTGESAVLYVESPEGDYLYFVTPVTSSRLRIKRQ